MHLTQTVCVPIQDKSVNRKKYTRDMTFVFKRSKEKRFKYPILKLNYPVS